MLKAVFFDLDGTLLPMDDEAFTKMYFYSLHNKIKDHGYENRDELIKVIWDGTKAMMKNEGNISNEEMFWNVFSSHYGEKVFKDKPLFDDFYLNEFKNTKVCCKDNPLAKDIIKFLKDNQITPILATNPIFPEEATKCRLSFIGLTFDDFKYVTTYENSNYAKPNPMYFTWLLNKFNLKANEVIMFGNNDYEDYVCATKAGIDTYLVGDTLLIHKELNISFPHIKMDEVIDIIKKEMEKRKND